MGNVQFDEAQKKAITISENAVVSAGAGSGKTSVLSARFSHLVLQRHLSVDQILTLTYTKKATVEMYGRIYQTLLKEAPDAAKDFSKANIKTIDAYCAAVAKKGINRYGISPIFSEDKDAVLDMASRLALPFILRYQNNPAIRRIVKTQNLADVAVSLFATTIIEHSTVSTKIDFEGALKKQREHVVYKWTAECKHALDLLKDLNNLLLEFEGNRNLGFIVKLDAALKQELNEAPILQEQDFAEGNVEKAVSFALQIHDIAFLVPRGGGLDSLKEKLYDLRNVYTSLACLANYVNGYPMVQSLIPLITEFQELVNQAKRSSSTLTYADVADVALSLLRDEPSVREDEKQLYKAIMIDEFQDNNSMQRDLLFLLAEKDGRTQKAVPLVDELYPNKLFFVGDEKQSIYRFRGADVSVFNSLANDFKKGNLALKTNYRSHPSLIAAFNTIFGGEPYPPKGASEMRGPAVFYTEYDNPSALPGYEAVYHNALLPLAPETDGDESYAPRVHIALYDKNQNPLNKACDEEAEALYVAHKIEELIDSGVKPGDIAILFRTYALQPLYEKTLLSMGIPYNTETVTGLFNSAVVRDMFNFMRIVAYPYDAASYSQVLSSAFVNLSYEEANAILVQSMEPFAIDASVALSKESLVRYNAAKDLYNRVCYIASHCKLTDVVSELWYGAGYRYETMWNTRVAMYSNLYDRIYELARRGDLEAQSLAEFVDSVRTYEDEATHLDNMDIPLEQKDGVHLLTIFKSKGLQYNIVFICGTHKGSFNEKNDSPAFFSKEFGIILNTPYHKALGINKNYFFEMAKKENQRMECAELRRLVYVAITRARKSVYITGVTDGDFSKAESFLPSGEGRPNTILKVLMPCIAYYILPEHKNSSPFTYETIFPQERLSGVYGCTKEDVAKAIAHAYKASNVIDLEVPAVVYLKPSHLYATDEVYFSGEPKIEAPYKEINALVEGSVPVSATEGEKKPKPRFSYANFGSVEHAYLEAAIKGCEVSIPYEAISGLDGDAEKERTLRKICSEMRDAFMETPLAERARKAVWAKAEFSFKSRINDVILNGQMDLVFKENNGNYVIVDYKTNQIVEPSEYYLQLACYRQAISQIFRCPEKNIECYLYYLRYGKTVDISAECATVSVADAVAKLSR